MKKYISVKRVLFFLLALFNSQFLFAQNMSINNTGNAPDASSMLDVSSDTKGLLIPRISLTLTTTASPVTSPANSLLVYNTNTAGDVTPGYYYWYSAQAKWVRVGKTYTASNGLNIASDDIKLGGTLIQNTTITQGNFNMNFNISGTGNFDVQHDGTSKLYVKDGGYIGINTNNPAYQFTIGGTGTIFGVDNTATFCAKNSAGTYENYFWPRWSDNIMYMNYGSGGFHIRNNSSATTMFMTNAGNVGIANTSPAEKLDVTGNVRFSNALMPAGNAGTSGQILISQGAGVAPVWTTLFKPTQMVMYNSTGTCCVNTVNPTWVNFPGCAASLALTAGQKVMVWATGAAMADSDCDGTSNLSRTIYNVRVAVNGGDFPNGAWCRDMVDNDNDWTVFSSWSISGEYDVPANGTYNFNLQASIQSGSNCIMGGDATSSLQASLIFLIFSP